MSSDNLTSSRIFSQKLGKHFGFASLAMILTSDRVLGELILGSMMMNHLVRGLRYGPFRKAFLLLFFFFSFLNKHTLGSF